MTKEISRIKFATNCTTLIKGNITKEHQDGPSTFLFPAVNVESNLHVIDTSAKQNQLKSAGSMEKFTCVLLKDKSTDLNTPKCEHFENSKLFRVIWKEPESNISTSVMDETAKSEETLPEKVETNSDVINSCCSPESGFGSELQYSPQTSLVQLNDTAPVTPSQELLSDEEMPQIVSITSLATHNHKRSFDRTSCKDATTTPTKQKRKSAEKRLTSTKTEAPNRLGAPINSSTRLYPKEIAVQNTSRLYIQTDPSTYKKSLCFHEDSSKNAIEMNNTYTETKCSTFISKPANLIAPSLTHVLPAFLTGRPAHVSRLSVQNCLHSLRACYAAEKAITVEENSSNVPSTPCIKSPQKQTPRKITKRNHTTHKTDIGILPDTRRDACTPQQNDKLESEATSVIRTHVPFTYSQKANETSESSKLPSPSKTERPSKPVVGKKLSRIEQLKADLRQKQADLEKVRRTCGFIS